MLLIGWLRRWRTPAQAARDSARLEAAAELIRHKFEAQGRMLAEVTRELDAARAMTIRLSRQVGDLAARTASADVEEKLAAEFAEIRRRIHNIRGALPQI